MRILGAVLLHSGSVVNVPYYHNLETCKEVREISIATLYNVLPTVTSLTQKSYTKAAKTLLYS